MVRIGQNLRRYRSYYWARGGLGVLLIFVVGMQCIPSNAFAIDKVVKSSPSPKQSSNEIILLPNGRIDFHCKDLEGQWFQRSQDFEQHMIILGIGSRHVSEELMDWQIEEFFNLYRRLFLLLEMKNVKLMSLAVADLSKVSVFFKPLANQFVRSEKKKALSKVSDLLQKNEIIIPPSFDHFFRLIPVWEKTFIEAFSAENQRVPHLIVLTPNGEILIHLTQNTVENNQKLQDVIEAYLNGL